MKLYIGLNVVAVAHTRVLSLSIARGCAGIFLSMFLFSFAVFVLRIIEFNYYTIRVL